MKKSRSGYEETLGSNLVELPSDGANDSTNEPPLTNGVKESTPLEDLATLVETNHAEYVRNKGVCGGRGGRMGDFL